ncbi:hypothetical protein PAI11_30680 [Patulibacter medicamentivorans]|uniref:Uncharacterized protein n=1 Tax=Patulibacter medicamentivorans TaxID=1097667 RepID=H0E8A7_9ACTN|nr:hypothetical protein PAI11_30680 [Patulibacter medicamentivorans]
MHAARVEAWDRGVRNRPAVAVLVGHVVEGGGGSGDRDRGDRRDPERAAGADRG